MPGALLFCLDAPTMPTERRGGRLLALSPLNVVSGCAQSVENMKKSLRLFQLWKRGVDKLYITQIRIELTVNKIINMHPA